MAQEISASLSEIVGLAVVLIGAFWTIGSIAVREVKKSIDEKFTATNERIDERFQASADRQDQKFRTIDDKLATFDALHTKLAAVDKDLVQVRLEMATNFVRQEGLQRLQQRMEALFKEVFDKLDAKADKVDCPTLHPSQK